MSHPCFAFRLPRCLRFLRAEESDQLLIRPRGAGQEVGRSCIVLEFKGRKMLDCGIHPGPEGTQALPYSDVMDPAETDLLRISHFHLAHCGASPWFLQKTSSQEEHLRPMLQKLLIDGFFQMMSKSVACQRPTCCALRPIWKRAWAKSEPSISTRLRRWQQSSLVLPRGPRPRSCRVHD